MMFRVLAALALLVGAAAAKSTPPTKLSVKVVKPKVPHIQHRIRRGEVPSLAVNLGGWLVAEGWMSYNSPLWADVPKDEILKGEYNAMQILGPTKGQKAFDAHRAMWITEADIQEIAAAGLNTVRVPIGYWIMVDDPVAGENSPEVSKQYATGSLKYLDLLIKDWCAKYNLAVMVSLHALMGSQNGNDNSGPVKMGQVGWGKTQDTVDNSLQLAEFIAARYKNSPAFLGLNLMNEPTTVDYNTLWKYYTDAYKAIRATGNQCIIGTSPRLSDQGPPAMATFMPCPDYYNVWHEYHIYYKWGWESASAAAILDGATRYDASHILPWTGNPLFIGEWSLATPDSVKLTKDQLSKLAQNQLQQYAIAPPGWAFWAWRHDDENTTLSGWSLRQMIREGIFQVPQVSGNRSSDMLAKFCPYNDTSSSTDDSSSGSGSSSASEATAIVKPSKADDSDTANLAISTKPVGASKSGAVTMHTSSVLLVAAVAAIVGSLSL